MAQPRRHYLTQFGERTGRCLLDTGDTTGSNGVEADGNGEDLLVIEKQGRHLRTGTEPVTTADADVGLHRVAEVAQLVDVAAHGPGGDAQPVRKLGTRPLLPHLQQGQQAQ